MNIYMVSLGCAKNLVDTENLLGLLSANEIGVSNTPEEADAIFINTCGFIESAKVEAINTILEMAEYTKDNNKKLIVMGCLSQRYQKDLIEEFPEVDRFIAIDEYPSMSQILTDVFGQKIINTYGEAPRVLSNKSWSAYVKIADGCDNHCSFCAIPSIRGPLKSRAMDEIELEVKSLALKGVKEINLVAQDCSRYGYDFDHQFHLSSLLKRVDKIEGIEWIRLLYLYPDEIPDDLIETIHNSKHIVPYFDIPTQHGNDEMLRKMTRRGSRQLIKERVFKIRKALPNAFLRTTIITGFPGETKIAHEDNLSLMKEICWDNLGAFIFSPEEGTKAFKFPDDVPLEIKKDRLKEILLLQDVISQERLEKRIGQKDMVLVEGVDPLTGMYIGRSSFFAPDNIDGNVRFSSKRSIPFGSMVSVIYKRASKHCLIAEVLE